MKSQNNHLIRLKITVEYNGKLFRGWQSQSHNESVSDYIASLLGQLYSKKIHLVGSGRTDKGVHARGQVFHIDVPDKFSVTELKHKLNSMTRKALVFHEIEVKRMEFHARFSATARHYSYTISEKKIALFSDFITQIPRKLNIDLLNTYATYLLGTHDFSSFSKVDPNLNDYKSHIYYSKWQYKNELIRFDIVAIRFLRTMVRSLVGNMLALEKKNAKLEELIMILEGKNRNLSVALAEPNGLILEKVYYDESFNDDFHTTI